MIFNFCFELLFFYAGIKPSGNSRIVVVIDTSKGQIDTLDQLESVLKFVKAFSREYDFDRTQFSIIQKNGRDVTVLLKLYDGRSLEALETVLSPNSLKIGKPSGTTQDYQPLMRTVLKTFSPSKIFTGVETVIVFTKDNKVKQLKKSFQEADIDLISVIIGDESDKKFNDDDINSVTVDDVKKLPNVYSTLGSVIRERFGIIYIFFFSKTFLLVGARS